MHFAPGQDETITFTLAPRQMSLIDSLDRRMVEPGVFRITVGGRQPLPGDSFAEGGEVLAAAFQVKENR